jgi:hypothetical protein
MPPRRLLAAFVPVAFFLAGCSDPYAGRREITGSVKLEGQPLKAGSIQFLPMQNQPTRNGGEIADGEFRLSPKDGLLPGQYLVRITAGDGKTPANEEQAGAPGGSTNIVSVDMIPEEWNTKSMKQVVVQADGPNRFDFDIPHANPRARRR